MRFDKKDMKKRVIVILIIFFQISLNAQDIANEYIDMALTKINFGKNEMEENLYVNNVSNLRTGVLYALTEPTKAKKNIDNAIVELNIIENKLTNKNCDKALLFVRKSRIELEIAIENLQLGFLICMASTEKRSIISAKSDIKKGISWLEYTVLNLNKAKYNLELMVEELKICLKEFEEPKITCIEAIKIIESNLITVNFISANTLNSSWLKKVSFYEKDKYVIAEFVNPNSIENKKYIYCNVSIENWKNFKNDLNGTTYGERFNEYIHYNKCDCD